MKLYLARHSPRAIELLARRYENISVARVSGSGAWIAAGDEYGAVRIRQYPADDPNSSEIRLDAHCSGSSVAIDVSPGDGRLLSVGTGSRAIVQWVVQALPGSSVHEGRESGATVPPTNFDALHSSMM